MRPLPACAAPLMLQAVALLPFLDTAALAKELQVGHSTLSQPRDCYYK
jgi:hypothetical protein